MDGCKTNNMQPERNYKNEPPHGKTNNLHRRKQRRRSAKLISAFVFATRIVHFSSTYIQNFKILAFFDDCTCRFVSDLVGTQIVGFLTHRLKSQNLIRKTCPCNIYPLIPHFYIAKLGYAGVYLFFLFLLQNIDCGYSLEPPRRGGSNVYPQSMF